MNLAPGFTRRSSRAGSAQSVRAPHFFSRCAACVLAVLLFLPAAITFLVVVFSLGRPAFFEQRRVGLNKREFWIRKFRTMTSVCDSNGVLAPDELRQTRATRWLRRLRVDELPQLASVLAGDMAFIGPRPLLPKTIAEMGACGEIRCSIRPGLTGWAQVNGNTFLSDDQKLSLDIWYIDHRSVALDVKILAMTISTLLLGERINHANIDLAVRHRRCRRPAEDGCEPSVV